MNGAISGSLGSQMLEAAAAVVNVFRRLTFCKEAVKLAKIASLVGSSQGTVWTSETYDLWRPVLETVNDDICTLRRE